MENNRISYKLSRNIFKESVMKNLLYKHVKKSIDKNTNNIRVNNFYHINVNNKEKYQNKICSIVCIIGINAVSITI